MIAIAPARADDVAEILALERAAPEAPHWSEAEYRAVVAATAAHLQRCLLVARSGPAIVGFAVGKLVADEAELESVVVRLVTRRQGVGRALCVAVVGWAWERGGSVMGLEVRLSSTGAIALYRELGFAEVGRRRRYYMAPEEDAALMRLERRMSN